jgi:hypothetical protein
MIRVHVWGYRDGAGQLLPDGFTAEGQHTDAALVPALIALAESLGVEVCMATEADERNASVESWQDVSES